jgi:hypothetical protein
MCSSPSHAALRCALADVDAQFKEDAAASVLRDWAGKAANELDHKLALGRLLAGELAAVPWPQRMHRAPVPFVLLLWRYTQSQYRMYC